MKEAFGGNLRACNLKIFEPPPVSQRSQAFILTDKNDISRVFPFVALDSTVPTLEPLFIFGFFLCLTPWSCTRS